MENVVFILLCDQLTWLTSDWVHLHSWLTVDELSFSVLMCTEAAVQFLPQNETYHPRG